MANVCCRKNWSCHCGNDEQIYWAMYFVCLDVLYLEKKESGICIDDDDD